MQAINLLYTNMKEVIEDVMVKNHFFCTKQETVESKILRAMSNKTTRTDIYIFLIEHLLS